MWRPTPDYNENAHLTRFMRQNLIASFDELMRRFIQDVAWFPETILRSLDIQFYKPYTQVVDLSRGIAWPRWCVDGKMNIVHNCLEKYIGTEVETRPAMTAETENGDICTYTCGELWRVAPAELARSSATWTCRLPALLWIKMRCL